MRLATGPMCSVTPSPSPSSTTSGGDTVGRPVGSRGNFSVELDISPPSKGRRRRIASPRAAAQGPYVSDSPPSKTVKTPAPLPVAVTSTTEGRKPNAEVAHGEAVQVPGAATRDLLGLGSEKPGELPLEAQP